MPPVTGGGVRFQWQASAKAPAAARAQSSSAASPGDGTYYRAGHCSARQGFALCHIAPKRVGAPTQVWFLAQSSGLQTSKHWPSAEQTPQSPHLA